MRCVLDDLAETIDQAHPGDGERGQRMARSRQRNQRGEPVGREPVVGIEDRDVATARQRQTPVDGGVRPAIALVDHLHARIGPVLIDDLAGAVGRAIVDDDQFELDLLRKHAVDRFGHECLVVVRRHDHADQVRRRWRSRQRGHERPLG